MNEKKVMSLKETRKELLKKLDTFVGMPKNDELIQETKQTLKDFFNESAINPFEIESITIENENGVWEYNCESETINQKSK